jgi:hypothetical protein
MSDKIFIQIGDETMQADQEIIDYIKSWESDVKAADAEFEAKKAARSSALEKLAGLGLTEEEIAAL